MSNFYCHPGSRGASLIGLGSIASALVDFLIGNIWEMPVRKEHAFPRMLLPAPAGKALTTTTATSYVTQLCKMGYFATQASGVP
jgi:hypothetical protein